MWPTCIDNLLPFECPLRSEWPKFINEAFENKIITDPAQAILPIQIVSLLGRCSTDNYIDCPNMPPWHASRSAQELVDIGYYFWFDFDITDLQGELIQLRCVYNVGDIDCNDGMWGAVWDRNTGRLIANIASTGDCETTLSLDYEELYLSYKPHAVWLPFTSENSSGIFNNTHCKNNHQLEDLIRIAIRWSEVYRNQNNYTEQYFVLEEEGNINLLKSLGRMQIEILMNKWEIFVDPYYTLCRKHAPDVADEIKNVNLDDYCNSLSSVFETAISYMSEYRIKVIWLFYDLSDWDSLLLAGSSYNEVYEDEDEKWASRCDQCFPVGIQKDFGRILNQARQKDSEMNDRIYSNKLHENYAPERLASILLYLMAKTTYLFQTVIQEQETSGIRLCIANSSQATIHRMNQRLDATDI